MAEQLNRIGRFDAVIHNVGVGYREPRRKRTTPRCRTDWSMRAHDCRVSSCGREGAFATKDPRLKSLTLDLVGPSTETGPFSSVDKPLRIARRQRL
jgi:hypothetical protein